MMAQVPRHYFQQNCTIARKEDLKIRFESPLNFVSPGKVLILVLVIITIRVYSDVLKKPDGKLVVTFIGAGEGDSVLIRFPKGGSMLIDGGRGGRVDYGERTLSPYFRRIGLGKIDAMVLTHRQIDYTGGLPYILRKFDVGLILDSGEPHHPKTYSEFLCAAEEMRVPRIRVFRGEEIIGFDEVKVLVFNPKKDRAFRRETNLPFRREDVEVPLGGKSGDSLSVKERFLGVAPRADSIVLKIIYGKVSFLFLGDIREEEGTEILSYGEKLKSTMLKIPLDGTFSSLCKPLLAYVKPEVVLMQGIAEAGFSSPPRRMQDVLNFGKCKIFQTDLNGAIRISTDGKTLEIKTVRENHTDKGEESWMSENY